jgi:intracellular septation protein
MQLLYEIFPVFLFFIAFKFYDIYVATVVGIVATLLQVIMNRVLQGKWDQKQLITLAVFLFFGGMTLYFHNPIFVKWKPTVVFWIFTLVILGSQFFTKKPLMQRLMENVLQEKSMVPPFVWKKLNIVWALFFACLGGINLYVAYFYSNDVWVNFKFYGVTSALFLLSIFQAIYLMRYLSPESKIKK